VVSFQIEEDTNQGSNPGGSKNNNNKKKTCRQPEKIVVGRWLVAPVVGLGPPVRG